ncbi:dihydrodipicolinate reductase [Mycobacterium sp. 852002-51057_SCH5723018]|uniref:NAD(P)H-dependent amine dehydrogenase family protein n=1 Tax=Mycobacterium sp. 852002-51057_SCH5723018 TaxID=1834094 RepID=UPI000800C048|nr:dihydrodipicolinate reductase [Mycobacterium sp. 852002-51057_SCH5723018]OBG19400.1 dihydrodipicolinate reductase [Mycobacterium sp. 852002-51057_SCH5723018]
MSEHGSKRVVVWGTGFVGKMVIAEIVKHPLFELVGVGVSSPNKVGRDVGDICGLPEPVGITATDDVDALIALKPDALVHYGPTAMHAKDNIALITRFLRAGIDVCSTAMTPWVWPTMHLNPPTWIAPITEACELGESSCFTTGIDPGFANDLFPMTLMGLCSEVRRVRASELLDYTNYEGDYEVEMGIGREPEYGALLEDSNMLIFAWGATVPMIAHAAGIMLDEITTTWDKWVTPTERTTAKGVIKPGHVAAVRFTINGIYQGETRIQLEHVNRIGLDAAPDWPSGHDNDVYRVEIEGTPSIFQETAFRFTDGSGRDAATAGCLATGMRALNAVPAVNDLRPGWVTPLDLPLIAGAGNIR